MCRLKKVLLLMFIVIVMTSCNQKNTPEGQNAQIKIVGNSQEVVLDYPEVLWNKVVSEGIVYVNMDELEEIIELYSHYDIEEKVLSVVRDDELLTIDMNNNVMTYEDKKYSIENKVMLIDEKLYVAINYFEEAFDLDIQIDTKNNEVVIKDQWFMNNETVVSTENDSDESKKNLVSSHKGFETKYEKENKNIFLVWDQNYQKNPSDDTYGSIKYVNVLSPTWLTYKNANGDLKSNISSTYLAWAAENKFDVWVLVTNDFNPDRTHEMIRKTSSRTKAIKNLVDLLVANNIEGVNIDFENIYKADKDLLVQYVAELTAAAHKHNIIVSMDVTMMGGSDNWSNCYDRKRLGQIVDYLVIMAYDQHWASSPISGTVAGLDWVENGLRNILEIVPNDKIVLGMPLYTRVWSETPSSKVVNEMSVKSKAITMAASQRIIDEKTLNPIWDELSGQYYIAYIENQVLYKIWHEDLASLKLKANLVSKYKLAGGAAWRRGYEAEGAWEAIQKSMEE